ncbi:hypothetical protein BGZ73_001114 [Actinomortierella ambigua]|nr:hypothetical protein BGZ73_001114 [Actinomortierella ambigua]
MMHPRRNTAPGSEFVRAASASTNITLSSPPVLHTSESPSWFQMLRHHCQHTSSPLSSPRSPSDPTNDSDHLPTARQVGDLVWYSATIDPNVADTLHQQRDDHGIQYLVPDLPVQLYGRVQRQPKSWGLDRIDQRTERLDGKFHYPESAGANVTVYIIDTGVNVEHEDFEGRASHGPIFLPGTDDVEDYNGHGTFVAGVCCGHVFGVAKKARIVSLKTLDNDGAGRLSHVLAAVEWVVQQHVSQGEGAKSIINLSLGAEHNDPTNAAILEAMRLGVHFSIAAGNDGKDACNFSPASVPGALVVGATDKDDTVASYSNRGPCVSIYAPGSNIMSAWKGSNSATHVQSGTSMSAPHVTGLIALLLAEGPEQGISPRALTKMILGSVTRFSIEGHLIVDDPSSSSSSPSLSPLPSDEGDSSDDENAADDALRDIHGGTKSSTKKKPGGDASNRPPSVDYSTQYQWLHGKALAKNLVYVGPMHSSSPANNVDDIDMEPGWLGHENQASTLHAFSAWSASWCLTLCLIALVSILPHGF